jgi:LmbE family N-acetylglucosaminyl deacetylase
LHDRWQLDEKATKSRRAEDRAACGRLGAQEVHFSIPDSIYRRSPVDGRHLYPSEKAIFGELHPEESVLVDKICQILAASLPPDGIVICPLSIGGHVDHRLTRLAAEALNRPLWYYPDYPYVVEALAGEAAGVPDSITTGWEIRLFPFQEPSLSEWQDAIADYTSQISTFWGSVGEMRVAIRDYYHEYGGIRLARPTKNANNDPMA